MKKSKKTKKKSEAGKITKKTKFSEVLENYPETAEIFFREGMHCLGCGMASFETIEEGCLAHGINTKKFVEKLNKKIAKEQK